MRHFRTLHISDFHIGGSARADQSVVLNAFFEDVQRQHDQRKIDIVVFSGDLAFSGQFDEYRDSERVLLDKLCDVLQLPRARVVMAPGNHDIDRSAINRFEDRGLQDLLTTRSDVNDFLDNLDTGSTSALSRTKNWTQFQRAWYGNSQGEDFHALLRCHKFAISDVGIGIAVFNSAWRSSGNLDQGKLLIGDRIMKSASTYLTDCEVKLAVCHHPLDWLTSFDQEIFSRELQRNYTAIFTGHLHVANSARAENAFGTCLHSAAGSLYGDSGRDWPNCYSILDFTLDANERACLVTFRDYIPSREAFDAGVRTADGGSHKFALPDGNRIVSSETAASLQDDGERTLARWVVEQSALSSIVSASNARTPLDEVRAHIVEPAFSGAPRQEMQSLDGKPADPMTTSEILELVDNGKILLVAGEPGAGVTTAAIWIALHLSNAGTLVPIQIHADSDVDAGQRAFEKACRTALNSIDGMLSKGKPLPPLVVVINDAHLLPPKKLERLSKFIKEHPESSFVLGSELSHSPRVQAKIEEQDLRVASVFLGALTRRHIRNLVQKVTQSDEEEQRVLSTLTQISRATAFERVPFLIGALISVLTTQGIQLNVTDEITVIAAYSELLLGRSDRFENSRLSMTFQNREHLLQYLAGRLIVDGDKGLIPRSELERLIGDYFSLVGWYQPVSHVVDDLVRRWVLFEAHQDQYAFRQRALQAYFAAGRAQKDQELRGLFLSDPLRWSAIVEFMAGMPKNDEELLQVLFRAMPNRLDRSSVFEDTSPTISAERFDGIKSQLLELEDQDVNDSEAPLSENEFDDFGDRMDSLHLNADSFEIGSPTSAMEEPYQAVAFTHLLSQVLRSSELVENRLLKQEVLAALIPRWGDAMDFTVREFLESMRSGLYEEVFSSEFSPVRAADPMSEKPPLPADVLTFVGISTTLGAVLDTLSSIKLDDVVETVSSAAAADAVSVLIQLALSAEAHPTDWIASADKVLISDGYKTAVRMTLMAVCVIAIQHAQTKGQIESIERFMIHCLVWNVDFPNKNARSAGEAAVLKRLHAELRHKR